MSPEKIEMKEHMIHPCPRAKQGQQRADAQRAVRMHAHDASSAVEELLIQRHLKLQSSNAYARDLINKTHKPQHLGQHFPTTKIDTAGAIIIVTSGGCSAAHHHAGTPKHILRPKKHAGAGGGAARGFMSRQ
jgi:hypothetical protein